MSKFGIIETFESSNGLGSILPEGGGDALPFRRRDLETQIPAPQVGERFGFCTSEVNGRNRRAIDLYRADAAEDVD